MDFAPPRVHNEYGMRHILAGLVALLMCWVAVDQTSAAGNQLIAPRAKGVADEAATKKILANTVVVQMYPVAIDPSVFGSDIVKITIDGRERTFVGAMVGTTPGGVWAGKEGVISKGGAKIDLIKQYNGSVFAQITTTEFFYEITNVWGPELVLNSDYGPRRGTVQIVDDPRDKDPKSDVTRVIEDDEVSKLVRKTVTRLADGSSMVPCDYEFRCREWMYATNGETCPATAPPNRGLH